MIRMFVRHTVTDFGAWKKVYEEFDEERSGMGVTSDAVFRSLEDPNEVTVWHDFDDVDTARAFVESERLREVMSAAGVCGEPNIWFTNPA